MLKPNYNCGQQELYTVCRIGWQSCLEQIATFTAMRPRYTPAFVATRVAEVDAAAALPDAQARNSISQTLHVDLQKAGTLCLSNWQKLKRYIADAFTDEYLSIQLDAAGQQYYSAASNNNWDAVQGLSMAGLNYIKINQVRLMANQNMPASFEVNYTSDKNTFDKIHKDFISSEEHTKQQTEYKIQANNNIYDQLITMFLDGQELFKNKETIREQFVFASVLELVSGTGTAGLRGAVTHGPDKLPVGNATLAIPNTFYSAITADDGTYQISPMAAGTYNIKIKANGFQDKTLPDVNVNPGTISTLNIQLEPVHQPA